MMKEMKGFPRFPLGRLDEMLMDLASELLSTWMTAL
jgi:hypothetical protein